MSTRAVTNASRRILNPKPVKTQSISCTPRTRARGTITTCEATKCADVPRYTCTHGAERRPTPGAEHCARPFRHISLVELDTLTSARLLAGHPRASPGCGLVLSGPQMSLMLFIPRWKATPVPNQTPRGAPRQHKEGAQPRQRRVPQSGETRQQGLWLNPGSQSVVSPAGPTSSVKYYIGSAPPVGQMENSRRTGITRCEFVSAD